MQPLDQDKRKSGVARRAQPPQGASRMNDRDHLEALRIGQLYSQAQDHHRLGHRPEAEWFYRTILGINPAHAAANFALGQLLIEAGQVRAALVWLRKALESNPVTDEYWIGYANALYAADYADAARALLDLAEARGVAGASSRAVTSTQEATQALTDISSLSAAEAIVLAGDTPDSESGENEPPLCDPRQSVPAPSITAADRRRLVELYQSQQLEEAEARVRQLIALNPGESFLWKLHGSILIKRMRHEEALVALHRAQVLDSNDSEIPNTLGVALMHLGRLKEAAESYQQALALAPDYVEAHYNLGHVCKRLARWAETEACFRKVAELRSGSAEAHATLGNLYFQQSRLEEAEACYRRALALKPELAEAHGNLGSVLHGLGRMIEAESCFRETLKLAPRLPEGHNNYGNLLKTLGRLSEAETSYRRALSLDERYVTARSNLANVLSSLGRIREAEENFRQALAIQPHSPGVHSNLLFTTAYSGAYSPDWIRREAVKWEGACLSASARGEARARRFEACPQPPRPLRLGLLSAELGQHAVAYFLLPWLRALDRERIRLHAYPTRARSDPQTALFRPHADAWTPLNGLSDAEAAARIRADQIDVLVDTSGHTAGNRLGVLAQRVAPVQCHYIGYFATTGLTEMDWFLADAVLVPPQLEHQFTERIWRLNRPWMAYTPLDEAPEPQWTPDPDGTLWLGSFNSLTKVCDDCLTLWAQVLRAVPRSRLLLKDRMSQDSVTRNRIQRMLAQGGVDPGRVTFGERDRNWSEHMARYNSVDIALDPTPMTGGSTAFDALWMGVPLVTLAGNRLIGRQGAAALAGLGRTEWIAQSQEEYVEIVVALARDAEARREIRTSQRERMRSSPLCDGTGMARALETAFQQMLDQARQTGFSHSSLIR